MEKKVLELENAIKEYDDGNRKFTALKNANLSIKKGEFISIIGPSGSGKSTLLHLLGCLDKPTSGEVYVNGMPISCMNDSEMADVRNRELGFVFQAFNLSPTHSVYINVGLPLMVRGLEEKDIRERVEELLEAVGLLEKIDKKPSQLSGGERQRVAIARALANNPKIVLADEPTGNLDSKSGFEVMEIFSKLWKEETATVIIVTHEPIVASYSERTIHLHDGKIESDKKQEPKTPKNHEHLKIKG